MGYFGGYFGGSSDPTPPTVTVTTPTTSREPLQVQVYDNLGLRDIEVSIRIGGKWRWVAYSDANAEGFLPGFDLNSTITGSGTLLDPYILMIYRYGGWPTGVEVDAQVKVIDTSGNEVID